jgi:hypothetical protein
MVYSRKNRKNRKTRKNARKSRRTRRNYKYGGNTPRANMTKSSRQLLNRVNLLGPKIEEVSVMNPAFGANRDKMRKFLGKNMLQQFANPGFNPPTNTTGLNKNPQFRNWLVRQGSRPILTPHPPRSKPSQSHAFNPMTVTVVNNPLFKK